MDEVNRPLTLEYLVTEMRRLSGLLGADARRISELEKFGGDLLDLHASIDKMLANLEGRLKDLEDIMFPARRNPQEVS